MENKKSISTIGSPPPVLGAVGTGQIRRTSPHREEDMRSCGMPIQGGHDRFEQTYMAQLKSLLNCGGIPVDYAQDRAAVDTGLHLFVEGPNDSYSASQTRVWFQAKGKRITTLSAERFDADSWVHVSVETEHLRFWYGAPEPVYLVIFVESKGIFIAEDVRAIIHRMWPDGDFYKSTENQRTVTVHLDKSEVLDTARLTAMLTHRSMRIDGPAFQGRPLGHRFDPLRSELAFDSRKLWDRVVTRLLDEHRFRRTTPEVSITDDLKVMEGRYFDTMVWQSPAFAEFGHRTDDDFRDDPAVESVHGRIRLIIDSQEQRKDLSTLERTRLLAALKASGVPVVLFFFGKDLSGMGGTWRQFFREEVPPECSPRVYMLGTEAVSNLVLTATLVYLDLAPELSFRTVTYRY